MSSTAATASPTSSNPICPTTPAYDDPLEWFTAYAVIHMLSDPSRRVTYILWILIGAPGCKSRSTAVVAFPRPSNVDISVVSSKLRTSVSRSV